MDEDCTGRYTKSTDCHMYCTDHENIKAIDFLILNEIVEYLIKILTVCLCEISV